MSSITSPLAGGSRGRWTSQRSHHISQIPIPRMAIMIATPIQRPNRGCRMPPLPGFGWEFALHGYPVDDTKCRIMRPAG